MYVLKMLYTTTFLVYCSTNTHVQYTILLFSLQNTHQSLYDEDSDQSQDGIQDGETAIKGTYTCVSVYLAYLLLTDIIWVLHRVIELYVIK